MAAITTTQTGNWSATATWTGGVVPGDTDSAIIAHDVTVDTNTTIGTTPDDTTTDAITVNSGITLEAAIDVTLTCRGRLYVNTGTFSMLAGSTLILDSSQHATLSPEYKLTTPTGGGHIEIAGTSANRCTVRGVDATYRGYVYLIAYNSVYHFQMAYCDFDKLGHTSSYGLYLYGGGENKIDNCNFTDCNRLRYDQYRADGDFVITNTTADATNDYWYLPVVATTTGERVFRNNVFLNIINVSSIRDTLIEKSFLANTGFHSGYDLGSTTVSGCFFVKNNYSGPLVSDTKDCYFYNAVATNPHFTNLYTKYRSVDIEGCLFEYENTADNGDCILYAASTSPYKVTIKNNIVLPNSDGISSGCLLNVIGSSSVGTGLQAIIKHNTFMGESGGVVIGEGYVGHENLVELFKSNICWGVSDGYIAVRQENAATPVVDIIDPDETGYNWKWNLSAGDQSEGWQDNESDAPPNMLSVATSTFDQELGGGDPGFVDSTRNLRTWGSSQEGTDGSVSAALAVLQGDTSKIAELVTWVQAGFAPTNSDLKDAGHDGVTIGAVDFYSPPVAIIAKPGVLGSKVIFMQA